LVSSSSTGSGIGSPRSAASSAAAAARAISRALLTLSAYSFFNSLSTFASFYKFKNNVK
jgi:hypothetical protein